LSIHKAVCKEGKRGQRGKDCHVGIGAATEDRVSTGRSENG
jgi:hypothetical protein